MISQKVAKQMEQGSWIRKMFEEGSRLKKEHGADNVFDFSIGNPDLEPPAAVQDALVALTQKKEPGSHRYMSNVGYENVREKIAQRLAAESDLPLATDSICMTVGAAGALNVALKSLLDPGDEVIVLAPYFVEYLFYIDNHGGRPVVVACDPETMLPDLGRIEAAIGPRTKAIILNTPNNPSGAVYPESLLRQLDALLQRQSSPIYVLSDEPYRELSFSDAPLPVTLSCLKNSLMCYSWSKSLSLPGERIGFVATSPRCQDYGDLIAAIAYCNRTLGFVNAPALFQRVIGETLDAKVDVSRYRRRRDMLESILRRSGFKFLLPQGGFYFFPQSPTADDSVFAQACARHNLLIVPGRGFGFPGHFRLSFALEEAVIERSEPAFKAIAREFSLR